jgi:hypothetical protein
MASRLRGKETLISQMMIPLLMHWNAPCERMVAAEVSTRPRIKGHRRAQTVRLESQYKRG